MRAELDEGCVIKASTQFWSQMLAMTLAPKPFPDTFCVAAGHLLASVDLAGVWKGRIEVRMNESLAYEATAAMMMATPDTVSEEDVLDAVKEIANIIGGVIKASLPRPCTMTVPSSAVSGETFCSRKKTEDSMVVAFQHEAGELMVRVWEQEYMAAASEMVEAVA